MKHKFTLIMASVALTSYVNAQTIYVPYLPEKSDLSETLNSDGFSSFAPSSVYSLNFTATAGAKINYCSQIGRAHV